MDQLTWKDRVRERFQSSAAYLRTLAPGTLYGFLASATLLPLVTAVNQGDYATLLTLGNMAGSVGGNLIANQIQAWKDRSDAELAGDLQAKAEASAEWRQALDAVMEAIETARIVQAILGEADRDWFVTAMRAELGRLGNLHRYEAMLAGTGSIAQGPGAVAAGQGGAAIGGDVHGPLTISTVIHPPPPDPKAAEQERLLHRYLVRLRQECNVLPLASLGGEEAPGDEVTLDKVYIALNTTTRVSLPEQERSKRSRIGEKDRPLTALEVATKDHRLVLLGDPGSGKSTFVRQVVAWLASARLEGKSPPDGWPADLLPIIVNLRDLRPHLEAVELDGMPDRQRDRSLVEAVWQQWRMTLDEFRCTDMADVLADHLDLGRVLLVFDGLDEVPEKVRPAVRLALRAVLRCYPEIQRVLVTSRTRSYSEAVAFSGFARYELSPFDEDQVRDFVGAWYQAQVQLGRLGPNKAEQQAADLQQAALSEHLRELSSNPMLLTTMAVVHQREVGLPRERVRLYAQAVRVLLERWQRHKGIAVSARLSELLADERKLRTVLERVAYEAHRQRHRQAADLLRGELLTLMEQPAYLGDAALADEFLDYIDRRAGLLLGRGGVEGEHPYNYGFPHRTFQEYLAGCYLLTGRGIARTYREHVAEGDYWHLAAQLGAEELLYNRRRTEELLDLMYALCPMAEPRDANDWRAVVWSGQMAALLDRHEIEQDAGHAEGGAAYIERLRPHLLRVMRESGLTPIERAEAGRALGKLGDLRVEVLDPLQIEWCEVPAGPFLMGSKDDPEARDDEKPQHEMLIPYTYRISRYPITNAQFSTFVDAGGYHHAPYWREAEAAGKWHAGVIRHWPDEQPRHGPANFGEPFTLPNHPVVGITWYEALAFARWLTDRMREAGGLANGWVVTLPSEAEWEKAARGGDGRIYPWHGPLTPAHANYGESGIGTTSAVGCFPIGASPYGVEEMTGNILEWTRSVSAPYPYDPDDGRERLNAGGALRMLRGGSFSPYDLFVHCASRVGGTPDLWGEIFGFRIVLSPFSPLFSRGSPPHRTYRRRRSNFRE